MNLYTSLSPSPAAAEVQRKSLQSWVDHGHTVVCVQAHGEDVTPSIPEACAAAVRIARTKRTLAGHRPKPYVGLDSVLDAFLADGVERGGIINGDIEIRDPGGVLNLDHDGLVCMRRHDHDGDPARSKVFPSGFDMFILRREHAEAVPRSMFVIGQTWWDYWLPWSCAQAGHRLVTVDAPVIYHRRHPLNYAHGDWLRMTHHFCWLTGRSTMVRPQQVSAEIHAAINKALRP